GNAGMIVPSHVVPLAAPGMIAQGIRWMFNAESPFYIQPRLNRQLMKWGWHFYQSATKKHVEESIPRLRDISLLSKRLYQELASQSAFEFAFAERGLMMLYKTSHTEAEELEVAKLANDCGIEAIPMSASEVQQKEPELSLNVSGGVYYPGDAHLDPQLLLEALKKELRATGVQLVGGTTVNNFIRKDSYIQHIETDKGLYEADQYLVAGGVWSSTLVQQLGLQLPLQAGKGYSFVLDQPKRQLQIPSILCEAKVAITPMPNKIRFAGTMEIAGINDRINARRVQGIVKSIPKYLPDYQLDMPATENIWSGLRPCSPDGLPYIGRSKKIGNLTIAAGHAMMGLSLAPATGWLVKEILAEAKPSVEMAGFDVERFA
ncbi:MAG: FAD-dependent oxidoreductase, partial [Bacteroidota bacterium]